VLVSYQLLYENIYFSSSENDCARFRGHSVSSFSGDAASGIFIFTRRFTIELLLLSGLFLGLLLGFRHESSPVTG
jgi:hypothetical protein